MKEIAKLGTFTRTIFTDGSAKDGVLLGGSAAVICGGSPETEFVRLDTTTLRGSRWTSSYQTELWPHYIVQGPIIMLVWVKSVHEQTLIILYPLQIV